MGLSSISHWLLLALVVILVFGTRKLRDMGGDLGEAIKRFRSAVQESPDASKPDDKAEVNQKTGH